MKASPESQLRLLDLQAADADLDRFAHRKRSLPELADIERLTGSLRDLGDDIVRADTEDSDLAREQRKLEADVELVQVRAERDRTRLAAGTVSSARELEQLQSEIASLARRQDALEEQVLELMERREGVQAGRAELQGRREAMAADRAAAEERRDKVFAEVDASAAGRRSDRDGLAPEVPADLLALYEKIRADRGGVGAAALHRGRCDGCHLSMSGSELGAFRAAPPDEVLRCEECRRILVRTADSGL